MSVKKVAKIQLNSKYFTLGEFACKCGCGIEQKLQPPKELLEVLDDVRQHFGVPVHVTSGVRCTEYNARVGGKPGSTHQLGKAADIQVQGVNPKVVHAYLVGKYSDKYGIGKYFLFTHIDVRKGKARW